jgi:hypothetical protein
LPLLLATACGDAKPRNVIPLQDAEHYELYQDSNGQVIRHDLVTGEDTIVQTGTAKAASTTTARTSTAAKPAAAPSRQAMSPSKTVAATAADESSTRYQLVSDRGGRVIRLDKGTGEVALVDGQTATMVVLVDQPPTASAKAPEPPLPEIISTAVNRRYSGSRVTINTQSPVYLRASEKQIPLRVLAAGSTASLLGTDDEGWYHIQFEDPRWGARFGYVAASAASIEPGQARP